MKNPKNPNKNAKKKTVSSARVVSPARAGGGKGVGTLTPSVKATPATEPGSPRPRTVTAERALEALAAADAYIGRLVGGLDEVALSFRSGDTAVAEESLAGAVSGIHFLADILDTVARATGLEGPPSTDHELGRIALALHEVSLALAARDVNRVAELIEADLVPALSRLAPTFPRLEARLVSLA